MNKKSFLTAIMILSVSVCFATDKKNPQANDTIVKKTRDSTFVFKFEAVVDTAQMVTLPDKYLFGVTYEKKYLKKMSDSCDLIIGHDAGYRLTLSKAVFSDSSIFSKTISRWKLVIHSPVKSFANEPQPGKRYEFELDYRIENNEIIHFTFLTAQKKNNQAADSDTMETRDSTFVFKFEAVVDTVETFSLPRSLRYGVTYKKMDLKKLSDSCELMIGLDANFRLTLTNVTYSDSIIFSKKINKMYLRIHSPVMSFMGLPFFGRKYAFELKYSFEKNETIDFIELEARSLK